MVLNTIPAIQMIGKARGEEEAVYGTHLATHQNVMSIRMMVCRK